MRIVRWGHACVRIEHAGGVLVVDPGVWTEPDALDGADAVLVTHEHFDHVDPRALQSSGVPVVAPEGARIPGLDVSRVAAGDVLTAAGLEVRAVGGRHATTYAGSPDCANLGYIIDGRCYHPGDALHVPDAPVEILCVPMQAGWLKTEEAIDFVRAVGPQSAFGIHDGQINERGRDSVNHWLGQETACYRYLEPGEAL